MMPLFYRLRRSVALFVCPELSAEARVKATLAEARKLCAPAGFRDLETAKCMALTKASKRFRFQPHTLEERLQDTFLRVSAASDSSQALLDVVAKCRERNLGLGGDDKALSLAIAMLVERINLPVAEAGSK